MKIDRLVPSRFASSASSLGRAAACLTVATSLLVLTPAPMAMAAQPAEAPAASEPGDLGADIDAATAAREADPSAERWRTEAQAREAAGDYVGAQAAYRGELDALPEDDIDARRKSEADWERVREMSRGKVEEEPASTHRAEFDGQWVPPAPAEQLRPVPRPKADPTLDRKPERIITKWYFWVTVAAIAASAGAVAGIAIKAARDERSDALDASALAPMPSGNRGPGVFRF